MTDEQVRRYARHILLTDVGGRGQERLLAASCIVPVGPDRAAETTALLYLAAAGVGTIGLVGPLAGPVEVGEQHEQIAYVSADVGKPRGAALAARVRALNPDVRVVPASAVGVDAPALVVPDVAAWLEGGGVAVALARGGAAACALIGGLVRSS